MENYQRLLDIDLPARQSAFLWGPRKTGKSTLLRERFPHAARFDLLNTRLLLEFTRAPWRLRERVRALGAAAGAAPVVVDEVQKVPALLDEVHGLIESDGLRFILCGSSARKLKRGRANLLGGRAWRFALHPLAWREIPDFDLLKALNRGLVPAHYDATNHRRALAGYVDDYLKEEVFDEGLTRNVAAFARFFDALAFSHVRCGRCRAFGRAAHRAARRAGVRPGIGTFRAHGTRGPPQLRRVGFSDPLLAHQIRLGVRLRARPGRRGGH